MLFEAHGDMVNLCEIHLDPYMLHKQSNKIKFIDLFCGMGGLRIAMDNNGMECVFSSDSNVHAQQVYQANFGDLPLGDITQVKEIDVPSHDLIVGGFPCQSFSVAGFKRGFEDSRGTLFFDIARIANYHQPKVMILENVKNLLKHDGGRTFDIIVKTLESMNYHVDFQLLNAMDFGVPQSRERVVIVVNKLGKVFDFSKLERTPCTSMRGFLPERGAIYLNESEYTLLNPAIVTRQPSGLIFVGYRNKAMRISGVRENSSHLSRAHKQPNRIYSIDGVHPTLSAQESSGRYFVKDDYGVRKLSVNECLMLMGYNPTEYVSIGGTTSMYTRIGNSVCVPMFTEVAREVRKQLFNY